MRFNKSCLYDFIKTTRKKHNYAYLMIDTVFLRKHFLSFRAFPLPSSVNIHLCFLFFPREDKLCCCSVAKSCLMLCDPMNYSTPGFLSFTIFQSLLKLMSIEPVMPSTISSSADPFYLCLQSFPASRSFPMS